MAWQSIFRANPIEDPYSVVVRDRMGDVVARSRNLRGIRDFASRKNKWVDRIELTERAAGEGTIRVTYGPDGETAVARFASFEILKNWVSRWHNAYGADLYINDLPQGKVGSRNPAPR